MIIFILSALVGAVLAGLYALTDATWGIGVTFVLGSFGGFIALNKILQKKMMGPLLEAQEFMMAGGDKLQKKIKQMQAKPTGNPLAMQKKLEKEQEDLLRKTLKKMESAEESYKWNYLLKKQTETMRFQLNYQLKDYKEADKYLDSVMLMDPMVIGMKMARQYETDKLKEDKEQTVSEKEVNDWSVSKTLKKGIWKVRSKQGKAFLNNLYAWMLVQQGLGKEAQKKLVSLKDTATDEVLLANLEALQNSKASKVSLTPYGDQWWALGLQNPPKQKQQQVRQNRRNAGRPF